MSDEPPSAPSAPAEHPSVESNTPAETTAAQNDTSSSASGYATPLNQDDPQSKSPEQDKALSDHPASLKLRASLKKRKSQEAERLKQQQPDPLDVFGQVSLPSTGIATFPGPCYESAAMAKLVLTENHIKHHIFFNSDGFHNHLAHVVLASYSMGASAELVQAIYELQTKMQRSMPPLHAQITEHNFEDYLGQDDLYASYLVFFMHEVEQKGIVPTLNTWLFQKSEHQLLVRAVGGAIHALIHIGYGVEFNLPAILAEGLAQAAVHSTMVSPLFPVGFPDTSAAAAGRTRSASQSIASFASRLHLTQPHVDSFVATARKMPVDRAFEPRQGLQGFTVLSYLLADPQLAAGQTNDLSDGNKLRKTIQTSADQILRWASEWAVEETAGESWELCVQTTEELAFIATMLLGATSMRPGYEQSGIPPKLDFFIMHAVTSSIFLPSLLEPLSPHQRVAILRAHWNVMVAYWISRGRPPINIKWLMSQSASPAPPNDPIVDGGVQAELNKTKDSKGKGKDSDRPKSEPRPSSKTSPWPSLLASAVDHPDEHVIKTIRSLAFWSSLYGNSPPGRFRSALPDSEVVDGSMFIRTAGVVMDVLGWAKEGQQAKQDWDHQGIGFEQCWEQSKTSS